MANFFKDNADLQFYFDKWLDWDRIIRLTEVDYSLEGGLRNREEALELYRDVLEMVGQFAADEIAPKWDEIERSPLRLEDGDVVFPPVLTKIFDQLSELGLHGLCVPRELGGMNVPLLVYMMNAELFARADVGVMTHLGFHCGIAMALLVYSVYEGTTEIDPETRTFLSTRFQKEIEEIIAGDAWGSMDITEPDAGSDMAALRSKAVQDADGSWLLTGQKIFITSGNAKYHIVIARTEDDVEGLEALSLFMVPLYEDGPDGEKIWHGSISRIEEKLGHKSSPTTALEFEDAPAHLIGERGEGFKLMLLLMNHARVGVAFESIGISECALRMAREYAAQRPSMGKTIDRHEMIADYIEEMETDIQAMRAITMHAAYYEELSQKTTIALQFGLIDDAEERARAEREIDDYKWESRRVTPLIKYFGAEKAVEIARRGIQIHGGVGYTKDYAAEKQLRDAMVLPIYEGTSQIQALMAMKDNLGRILKDPQAFIRDGAQLGWRSHRAKDPLDRRAAAVRLLAHRALGFLITRTVAMKLKTIRHQPVSSWGKAFSQMDPKRDFSLAMLHAERLTKLLVDAAVCEVLWEQARRFPERRDVLERWLVRAEPRSRYVFDELTTTGGRLLERLAEREEVAEAAE